MTSRSMPGLFWLNSAQDDEARAALHEVCAAGSWGSALLARRPYDSVEDLFAASDEATAALTDEGLDEAMAGHPPIGRPKPGDATSSREQRGMAGASEALKAEMLELNLAYQEKFGHVFLICATGRTAKEMRDALRHRIGNDPQQERRIVRQELAKINRIRLTRLAEEGGAPGHGPKEGAHGASTSVSTHILDTSRGRPAAGVAVRLSVRQGDARAAWAAHGESKTDADGRCKDFPALPEGTTHVRLDFETEPYFVEEHSSNPRSQREAAEQQDAPRVRDSAPGSFFPEVSIVFAVNPGEHYHVPLLLNPFGYSVYRGS